MPPAPPTRRRHKRRHLIYYLDVVDVGTGRVVGHVGDLAPGGLLLIDNEPLEPGRELTVDIRMPEVPGLADRIRAHITVRWVGKDRNPSIECAGCSFEPLSVEDRANLDLLVRFVGFDDADV